MLFDNLDRQGTDIQLSSNNTSLLYLNFTSNVIGVANASPTETLTVGGNLRTPNIKISLGTISTITPTTDLTLTSTGNIKLSNTAVALGNVHATALTYGFVGNLWGYALSPAQPYITSTGTLTSLSVTGNVTAGNVGATKGTFTNIEGTILTASQPNITSVGTLTSLSVTGNVTSGNVSATQVNATTGIFTNIIGTLGGTGISGTVSTANVSYYSNLVATTTNSVFYLELADKTTGNSATYTSSVLTMNPSTGNLSATNFVGGVYGTLYTAAQPNITSVGTLTSLSVTGNTTSGNVSATQFTGNVQGTILTAAQPNITSVGTLTSLAVTGNTTSGNVSATQFNGNVQGTILTPAQPNITSVGTLTSLAVTGNTTSGNVSATQINGNLQGTILTAAQPNITSVGTLTSLSVTGNVSAGNVSGTQGTFVTLIGNLIGNTTGVHTGNVTGNVTGNITGNVTGTILTAAQPNITSVGTLTSLSVTGNTTTGNISATQGTFTNVVGTLLTASQPNITSVGTLTSLAVTGNITSANLSTGNITATGSISVGSNLSVSNTFTTQNLVVTGLFNSGNLTMSKLNVGQIEIANTSIVSSQVISFISGSSAIKLPVGGVSVRPSIPQAGEIRYNSDANTIEFYNGTTWVDFTNTISSQNFYGDGTNTVYTLTQSTTSIGVLVSINGTVQQPDIAYTVSGNQITFVEIPQSTDRIDVRFLAASTVNSQDSSVMTPSNVAVSTGTVTVDTWDYTQYRSAKYVISSANLVDAQITELLVIHNGSTSFLSTIGNLRTGTNALTFSTTISSGNVLLQAVGTTASNQLRIQKTYFIL